MSQSKWLIPQNSDNESFFYNKYISNRLFNKVDKDLLLISCFDQCADKKDFSYDRTCMRNCSGLINEFIKPDISGIRPWEKQYSYPAFNDKN